MIESILQLVNVIGIYDHRESKIDIVIRQKLKGNESKAFKELRQIVEKPYQNKPFVQKSKDMNWGTQEQSIEHFRHTQGTKSLLIILSDILYTQLNLNHTKIKHTNNKYLEYLFMIMNVSVCYEHLFTSQEKRVIQDFKDVNTHIIHHINLTLDFKTWPNFNCENVLQKKNIFHFRSFKRLPQR